MTDWGIAEVAWLSAARSVVVAPLATAAGWAVAAHLGRASGGGRRGLWGLLLVTLLAPDLVAGFGYSNFSLSLIRHPAWNEAFLTLLIGLKASAVAAVIVYFAPASPLSPAGRHLLRLSGGRVGEFDRVRIFARSVRPLAPACAVAFLYAFQQFELPSLTGGTAWAVTLFDRQALLPDIAESADPLLWPLAIEAVALVPVLALVLRTPASDRRSVAPARRGSAVAIAAWSIAVAAALMTAFVPLAVLIREGASGLAYVAARTPSAAAYWREAGAALACGVAAAVAAYLLAVGVLRFAASRRMAGSALLAIVCVPGFCGPLVPSLFAVEWLQSPGLLPLRDTVVPWVVVLSLFLVPRAVLLEALSRLVRRGAAIHLARALRSSPDSSQRASGRRLLWDLHGFGRFSRVSLLAYWGYLDLTVATILAPPDVVPVAARLYNLMHYGHNAALAAMTLVTVAVPALAFATLLAVRHLLLRRVAR